MVARESPEMCLRFPIAPFDSLRCDEHSAVVHTCHLVLREVTLSVKEDTFLFCIPLHRFASVGIVETLIGIGNKFFRIFMAGTCGHTFDLQSEQTIERVKVM